MSDFKPKETMNLEYELFRKTIDSLPVAVFFLSLDGFITEHNPKFIRLLGTNQESLKGKTLKDCVSSDLFDKLTHRNNELINSHNDIQYETSFHSEEGKIKFILVQKSAIFLDETTFILNTIFDISIQETLKQKIEESEAEKLISSTMLQKIRAGVVIVNSDLKIIESNLGFARMIGEENEELFETIPGLKGADLEMLVPEIIVEMFRAIFESGESRIERDIKYQNKLLSISIVTIYKNKIAGALIRDLSAPMLERAEIIERARQVNRKNMKTVQQIAFLLGENAAQTEELLNSIIESQKYSVDEKN